MIDKGSRIMIIDKIGYDAISFPWWLYALVKVRQMHICCLRLFRLPTAIL